MRVTKFITDEMQIAEFTEIVDAAGGYVTVQPVGRGYLVAADVEWAVVETVRAYRPSREVAP